MVAQYSIKRHVELAERRQQVIDPVRLRIIGDVAGKEGSIDVLRIDTVDDALHRHRI